MSLYMSRRTGMEFSFLYISYVLQFHSAFASPADRWQSIDEVRPAGLPSQYNENGYECGNDFFSDADIKDALSMYYQHVNQNNPTYHAPLVYPDFQQFPNDSQELDDPVEVEDLNVLQYLDEESNIPLENNIPQAYQYTPQYFSPKTYQGPLYGDSGSSNMILWPIQKEKWILSSIKSSNDPYYIVIQKNNGQVVDVISRTINNNHTKCIRIVGSRELSTIAPGMNNGYQCAHEFLSDDLIQKSLHLLWNNIGMPDIYPVSFVGRLYPENGGFKIWPIFSRDELYDYSSVEVGPYFLVINNQGNLVGVVVEGLSSNFLRCPRSRNVSKTPPSNAPNHSHVPKKIIESGYYCGRVFFDDNAVRKAADGVRTTQKKRALQELPSKYKGSQLDEKIFLWPLMQNGKLYQTGPLGYYRVVLTKELRLKGVAIMRKGNFQLCEKGAKEQERDHEKSNYVCIDHVLSNRDLEEAAESGCKSFLNQRVGKVFPASYKGPKFDKSGPYFTYPVVQGGSFIASPGRDRVVINSKCEIVGALTSFPVNHDKYRAKKFVLCIKYQESSTDKTYIEPAVPISEHHCADTKRMMNVLS